MSVNGFARSVAVEMVVNGVLRTLWVMSRRCVSMDVRFKTLPQRNACIPRVLQARCMVWLTAHWWKYNEESPACGLLFSSKMRSFANPGQAAP